ncbi:MAG TPA: TIR domain-containing protein [Solirubrobacteraceae bacterium]
MLESSVPVAHELLGQCIKQGQALVQRASLVGDLTDYEAWKAARKQWIAPTTKALEHLYDGPREAREFVDAVTCLDPGGRWQQQYSADLDCVKSALELLTVLQGELAFDAGAGPGTLTQATDAPAKDVQRPELEARTPESSPSADNAPTDGSAVIEQRASAAASAEPDERPDPEVALRERERPVDEATIDDQQQAPLAQGTSSEEAPDEEAPVVGAELERAPVVGAELATPDAVAPAEHDDPRRPATAQAHRLFLAHGRDERWKEAVAHLLAQAGTEEVTILNDHPEERVKLLEHIGEQPGGSRYAIVLLTADDIGAMRLESVEEPYFTTRPSQRVVFEMGFLIAALTPGRVCVLYEDGVELPYELTGISHVRLDLAGTWQPKLLLALCRAGFDYDLNRLAAA